MPAETSFRRKIRPLADMGKGSRHRLAAAFLTTVAVLAPAVGIFAPVLFADRTFAFRDAAHFYPPLWRLAIAEWMDGRPPLWNPYENLGQPLLAQPAAGVCYPGQLVFLLPLPFVWAQTTYLVGHVLLAAGAAYRLARAFRASTAAAGICAIAYAFSGSVLMQHTNAPFLVGAAWLPLAILCVDRIVRSVSCAGRSRVGGLLRETTARGGVRQQAGDSDFPAADRTQARAPAARWSVGLGCVLAMMVLGGDPQMAYNVGLIAALYVAVALGACRAAEHGIERWAWLGRARASIGQTLGLLGGAAVIGFALSAVQVLPSWQFAARSTRITPAWADRLTARLEPRSHHEHVYHFSVGPWRVAEFFWPNISGRQYPVHRRWLDVIPAEGRIWTPTLYMGILPLVLGLAAVRLRRGAPRQRWLSWLALLSALAGFGYYGLGWLLAEFRLDTGLGGPFGGLYWLMNLLLPGYVQFRYPAKLLVVTTLAMSVLAARGWDRAVAGRSRRPLRLLLAIAVVSLLGLVGAFAAGPFWDGWMAAVPADPLFGPFDASGAWRDLASGFAQTALLCAAFGGLLYGWGKANKGRAGGRILAATPYAALLLVAADLAWSNAWLVATAPGEVAVAPPRFGRRIAAAKRRSESDGTAPVRIWRHPIWLPEAWRETGSQRRLAESMRFDRDTLWPNYNFDARIAVAEVQGTMMLRDYAEFLAAGRFATDGEQVAVLDLASYAVLPPEKTMPRGWQAADRVPGAVLWRHHRPLPRAWIAGAGTAGRPRDVVGEACRVVSYRPQRIDVEATLHSPGLVVLAEQFYPGWRLQVSRAGEGGRHVSILRANRAMRAVELPAGRHRLTFQFRPRIVYLGAAISAAGWLVLIGWLSVALVSEKAPAKTGRE